MIQVCKTVLLKFSKIAKWLLFFIGVQVPPPSQRYVAMAAASSSDHGYLNNSNSNNCRSQVGKSISYSYGNS